MTTSQMLKQKPPVHKGGFVPVSKLRGAKTVSNLKAVGAPRPGAAKAPAPEVAAQVPLPPSPKNHPVALAPLAGERVVAPVAAAVHVHQPEPEPAFPTLENIKARLSVVDVSAAQAHHGQSQNLMKSRSVSASSAGASGSGSINKLDSLAELEDMEEVATGDFVQETTTPQSSVHGKSSNPNMKPRTSAVDIVSIAAAVPLPEPEDDDGEFTLEELEHPRPSQQFLPSRPSASSPRDQEVFSLNKLGEGEKGARERDGIRVALGEMANVEGL